MGTALLQSAATWATSEQVPRTVKKQNIKLLPFINRYTICTVDAFKQIGKKTTIDTLRHVVADALTVDIYEYYFNLFVMFISEIADTVSNIEKSTKVLADLKRRFKNIPETNQKDRQQIHKEIIDINHKIKKYKDNNAIAIRNRNEVRFMENVESLKDLKVKLRTQEYWADEFAISVLENALNVKFIIL